MTLTLYGKPGCHLCEDVRALIGELEIEFGLTVEEVDITRNVDLYARYRHEIPVLLADGVELARGRITERELVSLLESTPTSAPGGLTPRA